MSIGFKLMSRGERYENDMRKSTFDENDRIDVDYVSEYMLNCATPEDSLAKNYEIQNDLTITLEIPKTDYKNPSIQSILKWANQPVQHDDYYRDLAVNVTLAGGYRTIVLSHARITLEEEDISQSDIVTMRIFAKQKEDKYHGVVGGEGLESTYEKMRESVANPWTMNTIAAGVQLASTPPAETEPRDDIFIVFRQTTASNTSPIEVFSSNVTKINSTVEGAWSVTQGTNQRTQREMLELGYRWEKEVREERPRRSPFSSDIVTLSITTYYLRHLASIAVEGRNFRQNAYLHNERCCVIDPVALFVALGISEEHIREAANLYDISAFAAFPNQQQLFISINKVQVGNMWLNNVLASEVQEKLGELTGHTLEWVAGSRLATFVKNNVIPQASTMMSNVARDITLPVESEERRFAMVTLGQALLDKGYEPAFVAGMMANIMREGSFGQFENSNYQTNPQHMPGYLRYFVDNHNYTERFSNKIITDVDATLQEIYDMASNSPGHDSSPNQANIFGIGIIQWTHRTRNLPLIRAYMVAAGNGRLTREQMISVEIARMVSEIGDRGMRGHIGTGERIPGRLHIPWYTDLPDFWRQNNNDIDSEEAARSAGYMITRAYARPRDAANKAFIRGDDAVLIYRVMLQ